MYRGFWLWEARSVAVYEGLRLWEVRFVVFYKGLRFSGGRMSNQPVAPGGSAKERPSRAWGEGEGPPPYPPENPSHILLTEAWHGECVFEFAILENSDASSRAVG